jgi:hypothetical protein
MAGVTVAVTVTCWLTVELGGDTTTTVVVEAALTI